MRSLDQEHGLIPEQIAHLFALRKLRAAAERGEIAALASPVLLSGRVPLNDAGLVG